MERNTTSLSFNIFAGADEPGVDEECGLLCKLNFNIMRFFGLLLCLCIFSVSCKKGEDLLAIVAEASGTNISPTPVALAGSANLSGNYNEESRIFSYRISWVNLTDTVTRINFGGSADAGATAPVVTEITLGLRGNSGSIAGFTTFRNSIGRNCLPVRCTCLCNQKLFQTAS